MNSNGIQLAVLLENSLGAPIDASVNAAYILYIARMSTARNAPLRDRSRRQWSRVSAVARVIQGKLDVIINSYAGTRVCVRILSVYPSARSRPRFVLRRLGKSEKISLLERARTRAFLHPTRSVIRVTRFHDGSLIRRARNTPPGQPRVSRRWNPILGRDSTVERAERPYVVREFYLGCLPTHRLILYEGELQSSLILVLNPFNT